MGQAPLKIAALCPTYNRPRLLGRMVAMFLAQDYPNKELIILDDAGQYGDTSGDGWRIVSTNKQFPTVGAKRNALVKMTDAPYLATWDDDDWYLPWALSACASALQHGLWSQPRQAMEWEDDGSLVRYNTNAPGRIDFCYGGSWSFHRSTFLDAGGYSENEGNGEDTILAYKLWGNEISSVDTISRDFPDPFYIYSGHESQSWHASKMGDEPVARSIIHDMPLDSPDFFKIKLPPDYNSFVVPPNILPRKW